MKHDMSKNFEDRMWFVKYWAEYIKTLPPIVINLISI